MKHDLTNRRFGGLEVISRTVRKFPSGQQQTYWVCKCECGKTLEVNQACLLRKNQNSCGCRRPERTRKRFTTHGRSYSKVFSVWRNMLSRCRNPKTKSYCDYGAKGVTVCDRWLTFSNFFADMGDPPSSAHTIERKDSTLGYSPDNCIWLPRKYQNRNRRYQRWVTINNETKTLAEWAEVAGIKYKCLQGRLNAGWSPERAIATPVKRQ